MIITRQWTKRNGREFYLYTGHYLFGVIPLYIHRKIIHYS